MLHLAVNTATSSGDQFDDLFNEWDNRRRMTMPPPGIYSAKIVGSSRNDTTAGGTRGGKVTFELTDPPFAGVLAQKSYWMTDSAMPYAKEMLKQIGVSTFGELDMFAPSGALFEVEITDNKNSQIPQVGNIRRK